MKDWSKIFDIRQSTYTNTVRFFNVHDFTKGDTYSDTETSWTNLGMHETMSDVYETFNHEAKHAALKREDMTSDVEHQCLKYMNWVECGMIDLC